MCPYPLLQSRANVRVLTITDAKTYVHVSFCEKWSKNVNRGVSVCKKKHVLFLGFPRTRLIPFWELLTFNWLVFDFIWLLPDSRSQKKSERSQMIFNKQFSKLHVDIHTITNIAEDSSPYSGHIVTTDKLANLALRGAGDPSRPGVGDLFLFSYLRERAHSQIHHFGS